MVKNLYFTVIFVALFGLLAGSREADLKFEPLNASF
jgi:hypothetical protein